MTLAFILVLFLVPTMQDESQATNPAQSSPASTQSAPASSQQPTMESQPQDKPAPAPSVGAKKPLAKKTAGTTRGRRKKKKVAQVNCNVGSGSTSTSQGGTSDPSGTSSAGGQSAQQNCPPPKIVVRQGGASEPAIQLEGGAVGDQAQHQRERANQMLRATEANLKQMAGRQLNANQQDMVNQIRQFMQQSKTAVAAGDLERGRTLAWKAQLLSEELVKPEK
jgi:hypothetical protein